MTLIKKSYHYIISIQHYNYFNFQGKITVVTNMQITSIIIDQLYLCYLSIRDIFEI